MKRLKTLSMVGMASVVWTTAAAQQATEVYIPIGESPGISESKSVIGPITDVEYEHHRMTISMDDKKKVVTMTSKTRFYIDKNSVKQRNEAGTFEDCELGRRIEAHIDEDGNAVWVKIAAR